MLYIYRSEGFRASAEGLFGSVHAASVHQWNGLMWCGTAFQTDYSQLEKLNI